jgi:hypothetical protein
MHHLAVVHFIWSRHGFEPTTQICEAKMQVGGSVANLHAQVLAPSMQGKRALSCRYSLETPYQLSYKLIYLPYMYEICAYAYLTSMLTSF